MALAEGELDRPRNVIHVRQVSTTLSIRLGDDLARWVEEQARATGRSQGSLVKEALENARRSGDAKPFMQLAGSVDGPPDLSRRRGFSRG